MTRKTTMTAKELEAILKQHAIDRNDWPGMKALVFYGKRPAADLLYRLHRVGNYAACLNAVMTEISRPLLHPTPASRLRAS